MAVADTDTGLFVANAGPAGTRRHCFVFVPGAVEAVEVEARLPVAVHNSPVAVE